MSAAGAVAANRTHERMLSQVRTGPPKRRHPALAGTSNLAEFVAAVSNPAFTISALAAQRACRAAVRRLHDIERRAEIMAALGLRDAAGRLAGMAAEIRAVLA